MAKYQKKAVKTNYSNILEYILLLPLLALKKIGELAIIFFRLSFIVFRVFFWQIKKVFKKSKNLLFALSNHLENFGEKLFKWLEVITKSILKIKFRLPKRKVIFTSRKSSPRKIRKTSFSKFTILFLKIKYFLLGGIIIGLFISLYQFRVQIINLPNPKVLSQSVYSHYH